MDTFLTRDVHHPVLSVLSTIIRRLGVTSMRTFPGAGFAHLVHGVMCRVLRQYDVCWAERYPPITATSMSAFLIAAVEYPNLGILSTKL